MFHKQLLCLPPVTSLILQQARYSVGRVKQPKSLAMVGSKPAWLPKDPAACQHSPREQVEVPLGRHDCPPWMNTSWSSLSPIVYSAHGSRKWGKFDVRQLMDMHQFAQPQMSGFPDIGHVPSSALFLLPSYLPPAQEPPTNHMAEDIQVLPCFPESCTISSILQEVSLLLLTVVQMSEH